jgi:hypothetical protein
MGRGDLLLVGISDTMFVEIVILMFLFGLAFGQDEVDYQ